ncbi:MAG: N-acetylmuramoyl-L-alanine amidase [Oscillospiraceae bacterium]|nr:N-acetylmuramoyl-L-alanine amidase [Oscillospiraceae bacterium]
MFITFRKWTALYLLTLLLLFGGFAAIVWRGGAVNTSKNLTMPDRERPVLVIDPGHGGFDGGALAGDGTVEAQINLAVSLRIEALAKLVGAQTVMTRYEDVALDDPNAGTVRERKTSDLKNRVAMVNSLPDSILVSIHQNSLPEVRSVRGAQVFHNSGSEPLAQAVQDALNAAVNDRPKEIKLAGNDIYLLRYAEVPGILVECGFLSNPQETELLCTDAYQTRLAVTILSAVLSCLE